MLDGLEHVLAVSSVVEEGPTLALAGERCHRVHLPHHQRCHQSVGPDAPDVLLVVDLEQLPDVVERVRCVVCEREDRRCVSLVAKPPRYELKVVLQSEILGVVHHHFLQSPDASHRHLDANHHVKDQVPVFVPDEYHLAFPLTSTLVHVPGCLLLAFPHLLSPALKLFP